MAEHVPDEHRVPGFVGQIGPGGVAQIVQAEVAREAGFVERALEDLPHVFPARPGEDAILGPEGIDLEVDCPYHSGTYWLDLRASWPEEWAQAVRVDNAIRNMTAKGVERPVFLHRSLRPLQDLELRPAGEDPQLSLEGFGNECEGLCGV